MSDDKIFFKACFDFARIIGSVIDGDIVPHQKLIESIAAILSEDKEGLPVFRYMLSLKVGEISLLTLNGALRS